MFSSKKHTKPIQSNTDGVGLDKDDDITQKVMSGELDPTSGEVMSALGIGGYDATAIENDPELLRELESICKDDSILHSGRTVDKSDDLGRAPCKNTDSNCEILGSDDEDEIDEAALYAQLATLPDHDSDVVEEKEENRIEAVSYTLVC